MTPSPLLRRLLVAALVAAGPAPTVATAEEPAGHRLAGEQSPYLREHAHDPVAWHPWGEEAFEQASRRGLPVFVSIGFSSCHWCHVMARESFRDPETAAFLNEHFICIKVDRDERPDIDQIYMTFVQATTGRGGWPLSVWLTPDRQPFAGGTYFAVADRPGRPGVRTGLEPVAAAWQTDRAGILASSRESTAALARLVTPPPADREPAIAAVRGRSLATLRVEYDPRHGGFGGPPKFPRPATLGFLLLAAATEAGDDPRAMAAATLRAMATGGIRDQLGGGFHRYATDAAWQEPHFEQLLSDQAQLACVYLQAHQATGDAAFAATARGLLDAALRDLAADGGGFYAAIDADSLPTAEADEPVEGVFYRWTRTEIERVLGPKQADVFCRHYGPEAVGSGVLFERRSLAETAAEAGITEADADAALATARSLLLAARSARPRPAIDDTLITSANGLMISALALGHQVLGDDRYLAAANAAADRLLRDLVRTDGSLGHARRGDGPPGGGFAEDHACLIQGLLDLAESSFDAIRLEQALALQDRMDALFWDPDAGGYFAAPAGDPLLIVRPKPDRDEPVPSANAVAIGNLVRLATILDQPERQARAEQIVAALAGRLERSPTAALRLLLECNRLASPTTHVVIAGRRDAADTAALLAAVRRSPSTNRVVLLADGDERLARLSPLVRALPPASSDRPATAFICSGEVCHPPTTAPAEVARLLAE